MSTVRQVYLEVQLDKNDIIKLDEFVTLCAIESYA